MSSEPTDQSRSVRGLAFLTRGVTARPKLVLSFAVLLALAAVGYASLHLQFKTSRLDLLNPASQYNQRWLDYLETFGRDDDAIVVFEGAAAARHEAIESFVARLATEADGQFGSILYRQDMDAAPALTAKALHFADETQRAEAEQWLRALDQRTRTESDQRTVDLLAWLQAMLAEANPEGLGETPLSSPTPSSSANETRGLDGLLSALERALADEPQYEMFSDSRLDRFDPQRLVRYLEGDGAERSFVLVRIPRSEQGLLDAARIERLKQMAADAESRAVRVGVTGMPILEADEMLTSQRDMTKASLVSLVGVSCLFVVGFGGLRYPLMAVSCLLLAMAWSFGYITLAVGHLNLLSVSFGVILIGLGIDFGIHYLSRYLEERNEEERNEGDRHGGDRHGGERNGGGRGRAVPLGRAIQNCSRSAGPGILAGGVTTSLAFFTALLTQFTGIAELGVIAGGGILLCLAAALLVLPAMLAHFDAGRPAFEVPAPLPLGMLGGAADKLPWLTLLASVLATAGLGMGLRHLAYDHNLLNLQAQSLESVRLERSLVEGTDQSVWFAVSYTRDWQEFVRRKAAFERLESVARTEDAVSDLPRTSDEVQARIQQIHDSAVELSEARWSESVFDAGRVAGLRQLLTQMATRIEQAGAGQPTVAARVRSIAARLGAYSPAEAASRMERLQAAAQASMRAQLRQLVQISESRRPSVEDLPREVADRFVGRDGELLLRVYARGNIWDMDSLERFVRDVERVDPRITGHPIQTFYASREMQRSYVHAACYSLLAVAAVLMIDFQKIRLCLLALIPVLLGLLQLFGLLGLLGIDLNPANMIVLPLILGIGIDDGVHVVHDFLRQRQKGPDVPGSAGYRLSNATATAIVLTSATTMVGFGSMMIARHQGLQSLGQVLTLGVLCCLLSSVLVLPALLTLVDRRGRRRLRPAKPVAPTPEPSSPPQEPQADEADSEDAPPPTYRPRRRVRRSN